MAKQNVNCWEYMKCGFEPGGKNNLSFGTRPAAADEKYHEINNGKNGGRFCWLIEGTTCNGIVHDSFFEKISQCLECKFYLLVQKQENRYVSAMRNEVL